MFYPDKAFIDNLKEGEKFIFLKVICGLIASDRKISREEMSYLKEMALKYDVDGETLSNMIRSANRKDVLIQAKMIKNRTKALTLIKDLCMVANTDIDLAENEIEYILDVAEQVGIEASRVQEINKVVNEYLSLSKRACRLLEQEHWT